MPLRADHLHHGKDHGQDDDDPQAAKTQHRLRQSEQGAEHDEQDDQSHSDSHQDQ